MTDILNENEEPVVWRSLTAKLADLTDIHKELDRQVPCKLVSGVGCRVSGVACSVSGVGSRV